VPGAVATGLTVSNGQRFHPLEFTGDGRAELLVDMQGCSPVYVDPDPEPCPGCQPFFVPPSTENDDTLAAQGAVEPWIEAEITQTTTSNNHCSHSAAAYGWNHDTGRLGSALHAGHLAFSKPRLLDVNGDGLTDIVALNGAGQVQLYLNRGGELEAQWPAFPAGPAWDKAIVFDYNLDGRDDVLFPASNGYFQFFTYRNNSATVGATWIASTANGYQAADWNGDGLSDLLVRTSSQWRVWPHHGRKEGLLVRVRNGLGDELNIRYASLSRADDGYTLYQGHLDDGAPTNAPRIRHFRGPVFVVENFAADSGVNSASGQSQPVVTQYRYAGAKLNVYGRGFLGFRRVTAHNLNTGIETVNVHAQDFPFTGMVTSTLQRTPDVTVLQPTDALNCPPPPGECAAPRPVETTIPGQKIFETESLLAQLTLGSGTGQVRFPYVQHATEQQFEFGASVPYRRTRTDYAYNAQGNATQVTVTTDNGADGDVHRTTTVNTWKHTSQCPSRLDQSVVTQVGPSLGGVLPLSRQRVARFEYFDGNGEHCQLKAETSHFGTGAALTTTYTYDGFGNRASARVTGSGISPARMTTWAYDPQGRYLVQATNPAGHTESYTWHAGFGRQLTATDANGLTLSWQYDGFGRETRLTGPRSTQFTNTSYAWCGTTCQHPAAVLKVTRTDGGGGNQQSLAVTELDRLGREVASGARNVQGQMVYTLSFFDAAGRLYASSGPYRPGLDTGACWTVRHFDPLGRVRAEYGSATSQHCTGLAPPAPGSTPAGWSHTRMTYSGLTTTVIDPEGRQRQTIVNVMERPRFVREHDGSAWRQTEYRYDGHGNTAWVQDPGGALTTSVFDDAGRKISMSDPSMGNWSYAYNAAGELTAQTDANGVTVSMTYDVLGRILTRTEPEGTTTWTYDNTAAHGRARGRVTNIAGPHGYIERFWYHGAGGELSASARYIGDTWFWMHVDHDALGQVSQIRYPSVNCSAPCGLVPPDAGRLRVDQFYRHGQLFQVRERRPDGTAGTIYWEALEVDALGAVTREWLGNNLITQRYVNPATGLVESIFTGTAGNPVSVQDLAMEWDRVGNLTRRADHRSGVNRREDLGYDGLGRLTSITQRTADAGSLIGAETVQYGPSGNILRKGSYTGYQYTIAGRPHAVSAVSTPSGSRGYQYDDNGNLTRVTGPVRAR
jgi:YD repeat-containing protein